MDVIKWINEKYDINADHNAKIDLPFNYEPEYRITAIIGGSGTGKSTLLKKWFGVTSTEFEFNSEVSIFEHIYNNVKDLDKTSQLLFDVGLSSVPVWKNRYEQLSNGEKLRFEIAYKISGNEDTIFVDEFTSMLDRQVAENLTTKIEKLVYNYNKNLVICTAHFDVLDWLKVDRLVDTTSKKSHTPQNSHFLTHTEWKYVVYQEICGEYLTTITI